MIKKFSGYVTTYQFEKVCQTLADNGVDGKTCEVVAMRIYDVIIGQATDEYAKGHMYSPKSTR